MDPAEIGVIAEKKFFSLQASSRRPRMRVRKSPGPLTRVEATTRIAVTSAMLEEITRESARVRDALLTLKSGHSIELGALLRPSGRARLVR